MLRKEKIITMEREKQEAWELAKQLVQIDSSDPEPMKKRSVCGSQTGSRNRSQTLGASWQTRSM